MKKVIYEVMWTCGGYICRDWFENECFAEKHAEECGGAEQIVNRFVVTKEFLEDNQICFSDEEHYSETEWEQINAHEEEYSLDEVIDYGFSV